jgi:hypothetical protein
MWFKGNLVEIDHALRTTIEALANVLDRLEKVERRPQLRYAGTWREGTGYLEGEVVTHRGGMWVCLQSTAARPGEAPLAWQLAVKAGRPGRDAPAPKSSDG